MCEKSGRSRGQWVTGHLHVAHAFLLSRRTPTANEEPKEMAGRSVAEFMLPADLLAKIDAAFPGYNYDGLCNKIKSEGSSAIDVLLTFFAGVQVPFSTLPPRMD